jgi:putative transcriptional regulator
MPMNEKDLMARDAKRDIGAELLDAVRRVKAGEVGRTHLVPVSIAQEARQRLGLSQVQFATVLGVSPRTLQDWEQKRRQPSGAARTLIKIAALRPDVVREAIGDADAEEKALPARSRRGGTTVVAKGGKVVRKTAKGGASSVAAKALGGGKSPAAKALRPAKSGR